MLTALGLRFRNSTPKLIGSEDLVSDGIAESIHCDLTSRNILSISTSIIIMSLVFILIIIIIISIHLPQIAGLDDGANTFVKQKLDGGDHGVSTGEFLRAVSGGDGGETGVLLMLRLGGGLSVVVEKNARLAEVGGRRKLGVGLEETGGDVDGEAEDAVLVGADHGALADLDDVGGKLSKRVLGSFDELGGGGVVVGVLGLDAETTTEGGVNLGELTDDITNVSEFLRNQIGTRIRILSRLLLIVVVLIIIIILVVVIILIISRRSIIIVLLIVVVVLLIWIIIIVVLLILLILLLLILLILLILLRLVLLIVIRNSLCLLVFINLVVIVVARGIVVVVGSSDTASSLLSVDVI